MSRGTTTRIGALIDREIESLRARVRVLEGVTDNKAPVPANVADQTVTVGNAILLDGSGSTDPEGKALTYSWAVSGVVIGTGPTVSYTPAAEGDTTVTLTVTDPEGASASADITVTAIAAASNADPSITSPAAGVTLAEGAVTVTWNRGSTTGRRFDLDVYDYAPSETEYVAGNVYAATGIGEALSHDIPAGRIPGDARAIYIRLLWNRTDGTFYTTSINETLTEGRFETVQVVAPTIEGYGDSSWPSTDYSAVRGGWMFGSMHGPGHNTDNGTVGDHIVPFIAEATEDLLAVQWHNRFHYDATRAWSSGNYGWGESGGLYRIDVIELSISAAGVLTEGQSICNTMEVVPFAKDRNGYPVYPLGSPAPVVAGKLYGVRMVNLKPPPNGGHASNHSTSQWQSYPSDVGAIALNGQIMQAVVSGKESLHMGPIQGPWGWRAFTNRGSGYEPNLNVMYFAVIGAVSGGYGHLTTAYNKNNNYDSAPNVRTFSSGSRFRQIVDYSSPTRAYKGLWLHVGHDRSQSTVGGSVSAEVKSGSTVVASGSIAPSQATLDRARSVGKATGSWLYCPFGSPVTLQRDTQYTIEVQPTGGCHLQVSSFYPNSGARAALSAAGYSSRDETSGRAQYQSGSSWLDWGGGYVNNRYIGYALVIDGAPTNINELPA